MPLSVKKHDTLISVQEAHVVFITVILLSIQLSYFVILRNIGASPESLKSQRNSYSVKGLSVK